MTRWWEAEMRTGFGFLGLALGFGLVHCSSLPDMCHGDECNTQPSPDGSTTETDAGEDGGLAPDSGADGGQDGGYVEPPEGCDPTQEPKDAPKCVVGDYGVFVDGTSGNDANSGTKTSPVKTFGEALKKMGSKPRIYVCAGTYEESVKLTSAVSVYGGFACGTWSYTGTKAKLAPKAAGYALEIEGVDSAIEVADVEGVALDGTSAQASSIAARVVGSKVRLRRVKLVAGKGADGVDGTAGGTATLLGGGNLNGNPANGDAAGTIKTCKYSDNTISSGGGGGLKEMAKKELPI